MNLEEAMEYANGVLIKEGLYKTWKIEYNTRLRTVFGRCKTRDKVIQLNPYLVEANIKEHVVDTILHEIAHALTPKEMKPHGRDWKRVARRLGASTTRCYDKSVVVPEWLRRRT